MRTGTVPAEKCFPSPCKITARVCSGGSLKKESMPAIVVSSKAFLLAGATVVTASPDHAGLRSGCSAESALPGSRSFPGARHRVIGPNSFVRHVPSGAVSYVSCRFDRSDETYRNSPLLSCGTKLLRPLSCFDIACCKLRSDEHRRHWLSTPFCSYGGALRVAPESSLEVASQGSSA
jgi:hypothetical protein